MAQINLFRAKETDKTEDDIFIGRNMAAGHIRRDGRDVADLRRWTIGGKAIFYRAPINITEVNVGMDDILNPGAMIVKKVASDMVGGPVIGGKGHSVCDSDKIESGFDYEKRAVGDGFADIGYILDVDRFPDRDRLATFADFKRGFPEFFFKGADIGLFMLKSVIQSDVEDFHPGMDERVNTFREFPGCGVTDNRFAGQGFKEPLIKSELFMGYTGT